MESISEFAMDIQKDDHFISWDIQKGYRHFRLAPGMRDRFIFRYQGCYYQCVAPPFGWGRSPLWFTQLTVPFLEGDPPSGIPRPGLFGRFYTCPIAVRGRSRAVALSGGARRYSPIDGRSRTISTSLEGRVGKQHGFRTLGGNSRQYSAQVLRGSLEAGEGKTAGRKASEGGSKRTARGWTEDTAPLLWGLCVAYSSHALSQILHSIYVLQSVIELTRQPRTRSAQSSEHSAPTGLEAVKQARIDWSYDDSSETDRIDPHRCGRCRL